MMVLIALFNGTVTEQQAVERNTDFFKNICKGDLVGVRERCLETEVSIPQCHSSLYVKIRYRWKNDSLLFPIILKDSKYFKILINV